MVLIINDLAYIAHVGDSRCFVSINKGNKVTVLTKDHKPDEEKEFNRIVNHGGSLYKW